MESEGEKTKAENRLKKALDPDSPRLHPVRTPRTPKPKPGGHREASGKLPKSGVTTPLTESYSFRSHMLCSRERLDRIPVLSHSTRRIPDSVSFPWFSLEQIEAVPKLNRKSVALISISSTPQDFADRECFASVLRVRFDDLTPENAESLWLPRDIQIRLFTEQDARSIWEFALDALDQGLKVWVHCRVGVSRSAAVAAALGALLEDDGQAPFERAIPNPFVYQLMVAVGRRVIESRNEVEDLLGDDTQTSITPHSPAPFDNSISKNR